MGAAAVHRHDDRDAHAGSDDHAHGQGRARDTPVHVLTVALVATAGFMLVEAGVGLWSRSLALLADAGHMLADAGALALALLAQRWAARPRTAQSTFGFRRAEVLAAFANGVALALTAIWIVKEAVERWIAPPEIRAGGMLIAAALGLVVNVAVAAMLLRAQRDSLNVRAAFAHVLLDAVGSVAALLAGGLVAVFGLVRADPALSVVIACLVAWSGWRVLREATGILLESAPEHLDVSDVEKTILACPGVAGVHDLHVWRISERFDTLTVHVTLARGAHGVEVCRSVGERLLRVHGLDHVTVQPEAPPPDEIVSVRLGKDGEART
jgi:cobalt-zinc-cadmium efflux system protein